MTLTAADAANDEFYIKNTWYQLLHIQDRKTVLIYGFIPVAKIHIKRKQKYNKRVKLVLITA